MVAGATICKADDGLAQGSSSVVVVVIVAGTEAAPPPRGGRRGLAALAVGGLRGGSEVSVVGRDEGERGRGGAVHALRVPMERPRREAAMHERVQK